MGVYVTVDETGATGPVRHIEGECPDLKANVGAGCRIEYLRNREDLRARTERCPACFGDLPPLPHISAEPGFLDGVRAAVSAAPAGHSFVYNVRDPEGRNAQVGKANDPVSRLRSRWTATIRGGYSEDGIPWLHHRLQSDPAYEPEVVISAHPSSEAALSAEAALRDDLRSEGWRVSSMV